MKIKELTNIKNKTIKELIKLVFDKKIEAKKAKVNSISGKEKNLKISKNMKRDIAQILTVIREKQIVEKLSRKEEK